MNYNATHHNPVPKLVFNTLLHFGLSRYKPACVLSQVPTADKSFSLAAPALCTVKSITHALLEQIPNPKL